MMHSTPSSSPHVASWTPADGSHHIDMCHTRLDAHFPIQPAHPLDLQPMLPHNFSTRLVPTLANVVASHRLVGQSGLYAHQQFGLLRSASGTHGAVKMELGADGLSWISDSELCAFRAEQSMVERGGMDGFGATQVLEGSGGGVEDTDSIGDGASPSSFSDACFRPDFATMRAKRKTMVDGLVESSSDSSKCSKKFATQSSQKRTPASASHITESGKPFPIIDTSAKHSSLFIPPDTSGLTKREARLVKNRAAAFLSRQRKREQFEHMQLKYKAISMLVWQMWQFIAGVDAGVEHVDSSALAAMLVNQDPLVRICLDEVISKKGASIAPTAHHIEPTPTPTPDSHPIPRPDATCTISSPTFNAESYFSQLERIQSELGASLQREKTLSAQLDALASNLSIPATTLPIDSIGHIHPPQFDIVSSHAGFGSMPFRALQAGEVALFAPDTSSSHAKLALTNLTNMSNMSNMSNMAGDIGFELCTTPTLAMFSENALHTRSDVGFDYRMPYASVPSSPSTASSWSVETIRSRCGLSVGLESGGGKTCNMVVSVLLVASMLLMGMGAGAGAGGELIGRGFSCNVHNHGRPSSHLSDEDLLPPHFGLDATSLSHPSHVTTAKNDA